MAKQRKKEKVKLDIVLSPTQTEFVFSDAVVNVLVSNTGEGKTFAAIVAIIQHAKRCGRPIHVAIVRDTHENIKLSTARSILQDFSSIAKFRNDYKQCTFYTNPRVDIDLFGIDDVGDLSKLQGPEYALIWLEEPAPMSDKCNAGLAEAVFNAALVRCARQKNTQARLQVTMNPADQEHWTYRRLILAPERDPDNPLITKKVWNVPYGENKYVSEVSRQAVKSAYKDDAASYMRYVLGKFAPVYKGKKVTPEYNPEIHLSKFPIKPASGLVGFRFWDGWHNPACVLGQITRTNRVIVIDVCKLNGGDIRSLINNQVLPLIKSPRWKDKCKAWRDIGDRSMMDGDKTNIQVSESKVIEEKLGGKFEPGPSRWELIKMAMKRVLNMNIMGKPAVVISPTAHLLHKALDGGWHFKTDNSGNIVGTIPEKTEESHIGDAFGNGVSVIFPANETRTEHLEQYKKELQKSKKRMATYAGS